MAFAQKASSMVLALRKKVGINVRKPLAKVLVPVLDDEVRAHIEKVKDIFLTEVNVKEIEFLRDTTGIITKRIKPNFRTLGKKYGAQMKGIAAAFAQFDQNVIAAIQAAGTYTVEIGGTGVVLESEDYEITSEDMPGWLVATEGSLTVALDIQLTPELVREGIARELIHPIQNLRKVSGFDVTDRIHTVIYAGKEYDAIKDALGEFGDYVASQTLSLSLDLAPMNEASEDCASIEWEDSEIKINIKR